MDERALLSGSNSRSSSPELYSSSDIDYTKPTTPELVRNFVLTSKVEELERLEGIAGIFHITRDSKRRSVLHIARKTEALVYILNKCSQEQQRDLLVSKDVEGNTPLHEAAFVGDLDFFCVLEQAYSKTKLSPRGHFLNYTNRYGDTILHVALHNGHEKLVEYLLNSETCTKYLRDNDGKLPLHWACANRGVGLDIIRQLLSDVDKNHQYYRDSLVDDFGLTPLGTAYRFARKDVIAALREHKKYMAIERSIDITRPYLHSVVENESADAFDIAQELLVEDDTAISALDSGDNSMLHAAVEQKSDQWVSWVLSKYKVDARRVNLKGDTPLHIAVKNDLTGIITQIYTHTKESLLDVNKEGLNPLKLACKENKLEALDELFLLPSNNNDGFNLSKLLLLDDLESPTPLDIAVEYKRQEVVEKILQKLQSMFLEFESADEKDHARLSRHKMFKLIHNEKFVTIIKRYNQEIPGFGPEVLNLNRYFKYEFGILKESIESQRKELLAVATPLNGGDDLLSRRKKYLDSCDAVYSHLDKGFDKLSFDKKIDRIKVVYDLQDWMQDVESGDLTHEQKCQSVNEKMKKIQAYCKDQKLIDILKLVLAVSLGVIAGVALGALAVTSFSAGFVSFASSAAFFTPNMVSGMALGGLFGGALGATSYFALFGMTKATNNMHRQTEAELQRYKPKPKTKSISVS